MSIKNILLIATISLAMSVITVYFYDRYNKVEIVSVDLNNTLLELKKEFIKGEITKEELEARLKAIQKEIDSLPKRYVVLSDEVVLKNGRKISLGKARKEVNSAER